MSQETENRIRAAARERISHALTTDVSFTFPPAQIGLAAVYQACVTENFPITEYLATLPK